MWHIDGHHKLIRWRFVTHGRIDGFYRTIVYLRCTGNNRAVTVMHAFMNGVTSYGVPETVRSDLGGENVEVWRYMIDYHQSVKAIFWVPHTTKESSVFGGIYFGVSAQFFGYV